MIWKCPGCGFEAENHMLVDTHIRITHAGTNCVIHLLRTNQIQNNRIILLLENLYTNLRAHTGGTPLKDIEQMK